MAESLCTHTLLRAGTLANNPSWQHSCCLLHHHPSPLLLHSLPYPSTPFLAHAIHAHTSHVPLNTFLSVYLVAHTCIILTHTYACLVAHTYSIPTGVYACLVVLIFIILTCEYLPIFINIIPLMLICGRKHASWPTCAYVLFR